MVVVFFTYPMIAVVLAGAFIWTWVAVKIPKLKGYAVALLAIYVPLILYVIFHEVVRAAGLSSEYKMMFHYWVQLLWVEVGVISLVAGIALAIEKSKRIQ